jgi:hypothetical protein
LQISQIQDFSAISCPTRQLCFDHWNQRTCRQIGSILPSTDWCYRDLSFLAVTLYEKAWKGIFVTFCHCLQGSPMCETL